MSIIAVAGISHHTAPVEIREKYALSREEQCTTLESLIHMSHLCESAILITCNRTEIYMVAQNANEIQSVVKQIFGAREQSSKHPPIYKKHLYTRINDDAILHLLRVAAGIDSMILGEPQILGQVRECARMARHVGSMGALLNDLFDRAIAFGKKVRSITDIDKGTASVPGAAVNLILERLQNLNLKNIVLIGTGKMNEVAARRLTGTPGAHVYVASRNIDRARSFAERIGSALPFEFSITNPAIQKADVLLTSTDSHHFLITAEQMKALMTKRNNAPILIIDIAVPRDIDPQVQNIKEVTLFNIDDLRNIVDKSLAARMAAASKAETLALKEIEKIKQRLAVKSIKPVIVAFRAHVEEQCRQEIEQLRRSLGANVPESHKKQLNRFARSLANRLAHEPLKRIKESVRNGKAPLYAELLNEMFSLPSDKEKE